MSFSLPMIRPSLPPKFTPSRLQLIWPASPPGLTPCRSQVVHPLSLDEFTPCLEGPHSSHHSVLVGLPDKDDVEPARAAAAWDVVVVYDPPHPCLSVREGTALSLTIPHIPREPVAAPDGAE